MSDSRPAAVAALVLGLLSLAAIPVAALVSALVSGVHLLNAELVAVPVGFFLGLMAVAVSRRARMRLERSVRRTGARLVRTARLVAWSGVYVAITGGLALAFYGVLRASS